MPRCLIVGCGLAALAAAVLCYAPDAPAENLSSGGGPVRIGMVSTLFRDTPEPLVLAMMQPFGAMMEAQTGLSGKLIPGGDAATLGRLLAEDKVQIAVFHGFEFAWARQRYPQLRPLMIAINRHKHLRALVVTRDDADATGLADLKGKTVALPRRSREHCMLYFDRRCQGLGKKPEQCFGRVAAPPSPDEALEDVVDGTVDAAVVDGVTMECFKRRKPARYYRLKVVEQSETFPAAAVAYHPGCLDEKDVKCFREGMMHANRSALGRQLLTLWKLTGFEAVPDDYEATLDAITKAYPPLAK